MGLAVAFAFALPGYAAAEVTCPNPIPVVEENQCAGGSTSDAWRLTDPNPDIAGFATRTSVDRGEDVELKIGRAEEEPSTTKVDVHVFRIGYYGGAGGLYVPAASKDEVVVNNDQDCGVPDEATGLLSCAGWETTYTIPGEDLRASGIYVAHLTATDTGWDNQIVFVVRDDERTPAAEVVFQVPMTTYEAYNNWGGKSLYDFNSAGATTVSGSPRAVEVSFDRPFANTAGYFNDWFLNGDFALAYWLERQGYDVAYSDDLHAHSTPESLLGHRAIVLGAHDEYWSGGQFEATKAARDEGVSVASFGADAAFWKVRYQDSGRTLVCFKTVQGAGGDGSAGANDWGPDGKVGTADDALGKDGLAGTEDDNPENATTTFRDDGTLPEDPNAPEGGRVGPDSPENSLFGSMYFGDRDGASFSLEVPPGEGKGGEFAADPLWRHTGVETETGATIGSKFVGWEWDAVPTQAQYLEQQPAGVVRLTESFPEGGNWLQDEGRTYSSSAPPGQSDVASAVKYTAESGAMVFAAGTDQWSWGLGPHNPAGAFGSEPVDISDPRIEQVTANVFADMEVDPNTPHGIILDGSNTPPSAAFKASPSPASVGEKVSFDASASNDPDGEIVSYKWDLDGDGEYETETGKTASSSHTYEKAGTYSVKLRVTDEDGGTDTVTHSLTVAAPPKGPYAEAVLGTEGLAHYWRLGESSGTTLADIAGGATATNSGATLGATGALVEDEDTAASFDGTNDSAVASLDLSGTEQLTLEFWLKWDEYANDDDLALELTNNFNANDGGFLVDPNAPEEGGKFGVGIGRGESRNTTFFARPSAGKYHHYAFLLDTSATGSEEIIPYVDGVPVSYTKTVSGSGGGAFAKALLHFMSRNGAALFGAGDLDDLAIYDRKLSAKEIEAHYEAGVGPEPNTPPSAAFKASPSPASVGEKVSFDASASNDPDGEIVSYKWDLDGDGEYETETGKTASSSHTYEKAGTYSVKLRVTDEDGGTDTVTHSLTVAAPPKGPYAEAVLGTEGLAHYWRLGESSGTTLADIAGGATATNSGATLGATGALVEDEDTAASFDGTNDSAVASLDLSGTEQLTLEFWLKWDEYANDDDLALELTNNFNANDGGFLVDPNAPEEGGKFGVGIGRGESRNTTFFARPSAGKYHHYAFLLDTSASGSEEIIPYVDGVPVSYTKTVSGSGGGKFAKALLHFMSRNGAALFGAGDLDDLAIYDRKLSAKEIADHFEAGSGSKKAQEEKEAKEKAEKEAKELEEKEQKEKEEKEAEEEEPPVPGPYAEAVLGTEGLAHYWRLGESSGTTLADIAGGATATNSGATLGATGALVEDEDTAASFDGTNDSAVASLDLSGTEQLTLEFWLKWDEYANDDDLALELTNNFNANDGGFLVDPNAPEEGGKFGVGIGRGESRNTTFFARPSAGKYHHYAFLLDTSATGSEEIIPYVDGVPVSYTKTVSGSGGGAFAKALLHFMSRNGAALFGAGDLDDLAIYDRKLSAKEIEAHYEAGVGP